MRGHLGRWGLAAALTATVVAGHAAPAAATGQTHDGRRLQAAVDDLHDLGIAGVQGLTRAGGATARARAGVGDVERGTPVPPDGHFRMASNSKTFLSARLPAHGRRDLRPRLATRRTAGGASYTSRRRQATLFRGPFPAELGA